MADSNGDDGRILVGLSKSLENKVVLLLASALLGVTGNQLIVQAKPELVRPDKFTGQMAKELESRIMREIDLRMRPHEEHLHRASKGWDIIYEMRRDIAVIKQKLNIERDH